MQQLFSEVPGVASSAPRTPTARLAPPMAEHLIFGKFVELDRSDGLAADKTPCQTHGHEFDEDICSRWS